MGNQKQKWTKSEEEALKDGVSKHGPGKWKTILTDPEFKEPLSNRSNIDLKDKWRNMGISNIPIASKNKDPVLAITCGSPATTQKTNHAPLVAANGATNTPRTPQESGIMITRSMVFEAISSIKDSKGSDLNTIASFIEQRNEVPYNFRRYLSSMLRRLAQQGRLVKVEQCYKIKKSGPSTKMATPKARNVNPRTCEKSDVSNTSRPEAAINSAAFWVVEAEKKSSLAAEAGEEVDRVSALVEESETMLEALKEFCKQYNL